jgi:hypothetical protein
MGNQDEAVRIDMAARVVGNVPVVAGYGLGRSGGCTIVQTVLND